MTTNEIAIVADAQELLRIPKSLQNPHRIESLAAGAAETEALVHGTYRRTIIADCTVEGELQLAERFALQGSYRIRHVPGRSPEARALVVSSEITTETAASSEVRVLVLISTGQLASFVAEAVHHSGRKLLLISTRTVERTVGPDGVIQLPLDLDLARTVIRKAARLLIDSGTWPEQRGRIPCGIADLENVLKQFDSSFRPRQFGKPDMTALVRALGDQDIQINGRRLSISTSIDMS